MANNNNGQHDFIEFVCKPVEDSRGGGGGPSASRRVRNTVLDAPGPALRRYSATRKHNGVDKETQGFFVDRRSVSPTRNKAAARRGASTCARTM